MDGVKPAPTPTPAEVARRLSPAQRRALMWLSKNGKSRVAYPECRAPKVNTMRAIVRIELCLSLPFLWDGHHWEATTLGLAVRAELERMEAAGDGC